MPHHDSRLAALTPLQRAIYETEQLGVNPRDSMRIVTARVGFFVGQERYRAELRRARALVGDSGRQPSDLEASAV